jgi:hypothetical protein
MLVATRSVTTTHEGDPVQITASRDHVIAAHPIVRANPDAFKAT